MVFCTKCGTQNVTGALACSSCQANLPVISSQPTYQEPPPAYQTPGFQSSYEPIQPPAPLYAQPGVQDWKALGADKKIIAGILGIILGGIGVHKFVLGYTTEGVIMLLISVLTCGAAYPVVHIIGIVEGIMYLTKSDEDFVMTYIQGRKGWF